MEIKSKRKAKEGRKERKKEPWRDKFAGYDKRGPSLLRRKDLNRDRQRRCRRQRRRRCLSRWCHRRSRWRRDRRSFPSESNGAVEADVE